MPKGNQFVKDLIRLFTYLFTVVLTGLVINDLSYILQKQGFVPLRFFLYMAMIIIRVLLWVANSMMEDQLPLLPRSIPTGDSRLKIQSFFCNFGKLSDLGTKQNSHPHTWEASPLTGRELYLHSLDECTMKPSIAKGSGWWDEQQSVADRVSDAIITVRTEQGVTLLERRLQPDTQWRGSKVFHKRFELDNFDARVMESMGVAKDLDENCTLQVGSFAVFKYTGN